MLGKADICVGDGTMHGKQAGVNAGYIYIQSIELAMTRNIVNPYIECTCLRAKTFWDLDHLRPVASQVSGASQQS